MLRPQAVSRFGGPHTIKNKEKNCIAVQQKGCEEINNNILHLLIYIGKDAMRNI
jgi:hypothetical protein